MALLRLPFAFDVKGDGGADEVQEGGFIDGVGFADVDSAASVAFEAGVEEVGRVRQGGAFGERELDRGFVGFARANDAVVGEDGGSLPLHFFDDVGVGLVDELADMGERGASPVGEFSNFVVDEGGGGFHERGPMGDRVAGLGRRKN